MLWGNAIFNNFWSSCSCIIAYKNTVSGSQWLVTYNIINFTIENHTKGKQNKAFMSWGNTIFNNVMSSCS